MKDENLGMYTPAVSPLREMGAYEALWSQGGASFKTLAEKLAVPGGELPSSHVQAGVTEKFASLALDVLRNAGVSRFGVRVRGSAEFPSGLGDAAHPLSILYFRGWWEHLTHRAIAIVGTRQPSAEASSAARTLVRDLVRDYKLTIVSGLAKGIDTIAHETAIREGGNTVAVLGTPIHEAFPSDNRSLFDQIVLHHLVVSQVPIYRWANSPYPSRKFFFPERNITMSALTSATVIVEAGETSGTLIQARAAIAQGRKLFLFENCFRDPSLKWPTTYLQKGAVRVKSAAEIMEHLQNAAPN
jgi:DNA processing protein